MKDILKLLPFHLHVALRCDRGKPATGIKPLSNESVRHIRRQNTHTAGGAGLEPAARKHVVPTYLPPDHLPPGFEG
jgi:hypothetical protein